MKKKLALFLCLLSLCGCAKNEKESIAPSSEQTVSAVSTAAQLITQSRTPDDMIASMRMQGWQAEFASSDLVEEWKSVPPQNFITSTSPDGIVLMAGYFADETQAKKAYEALAVSPSESAFSQNGKNYQQETINFPDNQGFMTLRQVGPCVIGCWYSTVEQQMTALGTMNSFQQQSQ